MTLSFGISTLPSGDDDAFLDGLVAAGHRALELAFVKDFPWKEARCETFGVLAAARGISLSVHAPYFSVLTIDDPKRNKRTRASVEHSLKLGKRLGARVVVVHPGHDRDRSPAELLGTVLEALESIEEKVAHLGVALGLETTGTTGAFGNIGDIALIAEHFPWVHPVLDWAHVHATTNGRLTEREAFTSVLEFVLDHFPDWKLSPLHTHFSHNEFGPGGEIRHVRYGDGDLPLPPLLEAADRLAVEMTMISEARDSASHAAIWRDVQETLSALPAAAPGSRPLASGLATFPTPVDVVPDGDGHRTERLRRPLRITNVDKPFFPDGYTKGDLIQYYASISPTLLPHLADRAIVMARFPDGADGEFFYEKRAPSHKPDWIPTAPIFSEGQAGTIDYCTAPDRPSLMWFATMGCIEIHPWLSRGGSIENPDFAIFDLDPAEDATWDQVVDTAGHIKVALDGLGLRSYLKTSGATGLHIYVPLSPIYPYRRVRRFVETVGRLIVAADPDNVTMEWDIPSRAGKVFIDHNQNVGGKTIASVYSVRPHPGAPVSTPLRWDELGRVTADMFTISTIWGRLADVGDLFAPVLIGGQRLEEAERGLGLEP